MSRGKPSRRAARAVRGRTARARSESAAVATPPAPVVPAVPADHAATGAASNVAVLDEPPEDTRAPSPLGDGVLRGWTAWRSPAGILAVVVLLSQLVWRAVYLAEGYFTQDDFLMLRLGGTSRFDLHFLFQDYSGHLFPGNFLIAYLEAHLAPLSWPAAFIPVLVMQAVAGGLMWMVLSRLLGDRWERLPLLAMFCLSPLSLWSTQWWAVAIQFVPLEVLGAAAVLSYLQWRQDGAIRGWRLTVLMVAVALMFEERAALLPLVVFAVAALLEPADTIRARLTGAVRSNRRLWLWLGAVDAGYLTLHAAIAPVKSTSGGGSNQSLDLVTNFLFRNLTPGIFGGPWTGERLGGAAIIPPGWVVTVAVGMLAVLVGYTVRFGGSAARTSWLVLLVYALVDAVLVFGGRAQYGAFSGLTTRYAADALPLVVIALAGAIRDVVAPRRVDRFFSAPGLVDRRIAACLLATALYGASSGLTSNLMAPAFFNDPARSYVDNLRADLAQEPTAVLYDSTVPDDVMISWFGSNDRVSTVYGIAPGAPKFDVPSEQMRIVDSEGHVHPIAIVTPVAAYPGPNPECGYNVTLNSTLVYLQGTVPTAKNIVQLTYFTNVDDVAVLTAGSTTVRIPVHPGPHVVDAVVDEGFASVSIRLSRTAGTLCLVSLEAGTPEPAP